MLGWGGVCVCVITFDSSICQILSIIYTSYNVKLLRQYYTSFAQNTIIAFVCSRHDIVYAGDASLYHVIGINSINTVGKHILKS